MLTIDQIKDVASSIAAYHSIKKISLFGSYADGTANENSDIDLLIEFLIPNVSLLTLSNIKNELEDKLKKSVDIIHMPITKESLLEFNKVIDLYEQ